MAFKILFVLALVGAVCALSRLDEPALKQEIIDMVNKDPASTWRAGWNNKFDRATLRDAKALCGVLPTPAGFKHNEADHTYEQAGLPDEFDSRDNWPGCGSIGHIRDQSMCGSCWAFGAVEAFEDRLCIKNKTKGTLMSPYDLNSCCSTCGMGCNGGYPSLAWSYFVKTGVVSGGDYGDAKTCAPYTLPPCDHHTNGTLPPCGDTKPTPNCVRQCQNGYAQTWDADKHKCSSSYNVASSVAAIQTEIYNNGPVEAAFTVYEDFLTYKKGVYQHKTGSQVGGHAIKILGWGVEANTPYWLVANSWNNEWGDDGYFKILRGSNHCGIEGGVVAGTPA